MSVLHSGFADPVRDAQACFRAVLDAMARPGTVRAVEAPAAPPPPLDRATAAVLLTLADADTPVWLDDGAAVAGAWVGFHCGAPLAGLGAAAFAVSVGAGAGGLGAAGLGAAGLGAAGLGAGGLGAGGLGAGGPASVPAGLIAAMAAGSDDAPEDGATLILQVAALGRGRALRLSGPGLAAPARFAAEGLGDGFVAAWAANRALFPRGVDVVLCAGDQVCAFPRTLRIEEG